MNKKLILSLIIILLLVFLGGLAYYFFLDDNQEKTRPGSTDNKEGIENNQAENDPEKKGQNKEDDKESTKQNKGNNGREYDDQDYHMYGDVEKTLDQGLPPGRDNDGDGLLNYQEVELFNTDPRKKDTDDDNFNDKKELEKGSDPLDPQDTP